MPVMTSQEDEAGNGMNQSYSLLSLRRIGVRDASASCFAARAAANPVSIVTFPCDTTFYLMRRISWNTYISDKGYMADGKEYQNGSFGVASLGVHCQCHAARDDRAPGVTGKARR